MTTHRVVSREEWLEARRQLLAREKELTRLRDRVSAERRALPWVRIDKPYVFDGPDGPQTLADLFEGRSQLIVQHFMFGPEWREGCVGCSFQADHVDGVLWHIVHRDVTFVAVSRAPWPRIEAFRKRMGWRFKWVSSFGSDFNYDFNVSFTPEDAGRGKVFYNFDWRDWQSDELPGTSVFCKDEAGSVYHTYSAYGRGDELLVGTYNYLDLTPRGREENGPAGDLTDWVKHHDRYDGQQTCQCG